MANLEECIAREEDRLIRRLVDIVRQEPLDVPSEEPTAVEMDAARRVAAHRVAARLLGTLGPLPARVHATPDQRPSRPGAVIPRRTVEKPVVTVRHSLRSTFVTFTATLARQYPIACFSYAAVETTSEGATFVLTSNPEFGRGVFTLTHNGGSAKRSGSLGRVVQLRAGTIQLEAGCYEPAVEVRDGVLVVHIVEKTQGDGDETVRH